MWDCSIDESGDLVLLTEWAGQGMPLFVICGVFIDRDVATDLKRDFLVARRRIFRHSPHDPLLAELYEHEGKGSKLRRRVRKGSSDRTAFEYLNAAIGLMEVYGVRFVGSVRVKEPNRPFAEMATYDKILCALTSDFHHYLESNGTLGQLTFDGRSKDQDLSAQRALCDHKYNPHHPSQILDRLPLLAGIPTPGDSKIHFGLQLADLLASALLFPMAMAAYSGAEPTNAHVSPAYRAITSAFGPRLFALQYRYRGKGRQRRGGVLVSTHDRHLSPEKLFGLDKTSVRVQRERMHS